MQFFVPSITWQDIARHHIENIYRHAGTFDDVCCLNSRLPLRGLYVSQISRYCLWTGKLMNIYYMQYQNISTVLYYERYQDIKILSMDRWTGEYILYAISKYQYYSILSKISRYQDIVYGQVDWWIFTICNIKISVL